MYNKDSRITAEQLKEILEYNPETGIFVWMQPNIGRCKTGKIAGSSHSEGYIFIGINKRQYLAHRLAWLYMTGEWPQQQIDHINHDKTDNRWENLRDVSGFDNQKNSRLKSTNKTGIPGIFFVKKAKQWNVYIRSNNKSRYLGTYDDFFEACCIRKSAERINGFHVNHGRI